MADGTPGTGAADGAELPSPACWGPLSIPRPVANSQAEAAIQARSARDTCPSIVGSARVVFERGERILDKTVLENAENDEKAA